MLRHVPKLLRHAKKNQLWLSLIFTETVDVTTFLVCFSFRKSISFPSRHEDLARRNLLQHDFKFKIHREEKENNFSRIPQRQGLASRHIFQSTNIPSSTQSFILNPTLKAPPRTPKWHQTNTTSSSRSSNNNNLPQATPTNKHLHTLARHSKPTKARARRNTPTSKIEDMADIINNSHIMDRDNPLLRWL
jgi:hypothetical protein